MLIFHLQNGSGLDALDNHYVPGHGVACLHDLQVTGCRKVHIVAHSMGNYVLYRALCHRHGWEMPMDAAAGLFRLTHSITFAAPDVARNDFSQLLHEVDTFYKQPGTALLTKPTLTLYCSRRDLALVVSSGVRSLGHDKSGRAGFFWRKRTKLTHLLKGGWWGHHVHPLLDKRILTVDATGEHINRLSSSKQHLLPVFGIIFSYYATGSSFPRKTLTVNLFLWRSLAQTGFPIQLR